LKKKDHKDKKDQTPLHLAAHKRALIRRNFSEKGDKKYGI
jgi:hypothetical protein